MHNTLTFDPTRAIFDEKPDYPPFNITQTEPLQQVLDDGRLRPDAPVVVIDFGSKALAFLTPQLVYHHTAQGKLGDTAFVVAFCAICNTGMCFSPVVAGREFHFAALGLYNGVTLMGDMETQSYWDILSGQCVYGALQGVQLEDLASPMHMVASHAAARYPDITIALSALTPEQQADADDGNEWRQEESPKLSATVTNTMSAEDTRLHRMAMGLGVWTGTEQRFYPTKQLLEQNSVILDTFNGRTLLVYIDAMSKLPDAIFVDTQLAAWTNGRLELDAGRYLESGVLHAADGSRLTLIRPKQLYQRWFSFAFWFPTCEIYSR